MIITPVFVFAQEGKARSVGGEMIRDVLPIVVILVILFLYFRLYLRKTNLNSNAGMITWTEWNRNTTGLSN
jgi:hypothetical protein